MAEEFEQSIPGEFLWVMNVFKLAPSSDDQNAPKKGERGRRTIQGQALPPASRNKIKLSVLRK